MLEMKKHQFNLTKPSGVPCPECGTIIHFTIDKLLSARPVFCSDCGLKLTLSVYESQESLEALKKLKDTLDRVGQNTF